MRSSSRFFKNLCSSLCFLILLLTVTSCGRDEKSSGGNVPVDEKDDDKKDDDPQKPRTEPNGPKKTKPVADANDAVSNFKGSLAIQDILDARLMLEGQHIYVSTYIGGYSDRFVMGLPQLLGYRSGDGLRSEFRNGKANSLNMVTWHLALAGIASNIARECNTESSDSDPIAARLLLNDKTMATLGAVCTWPTPQARSTEALRNFWDLVMSHDAPEAEFEAFRGFFQGETYAQESNTEAVTAMLTAMLYNPHFLLRK